MRGLVLFCLGAVCGMGQALPMEEAVARAMESHPDLAAARASRAVAAFQAQAARALPVPEFRVIANNVALDPEEAEARHSVGWRWVPPRPGEIAWKIRVAQARRRAVEAEIRVAEARVAAEVRQAYRRAALAEERARLAVRALDLRRAVSEVTRRQTAAGLKEAVEADLAELAQFDAEAALHRLEAAAAVERRRLARLIDPAGTLAFSLVAEIVAAPRAVGGRPELAQAAAVCEQAESSAALAGQGRYPWISAVQVTRRLGTASGRSGSWGFLVGVELPLFRSAAQAETRAAAAAGERCRLEEAALRARMRQEAEEVEAQWAAGLGELEKLERLSAGPAARALEHTRAALAAGRADRAEVLQAEARQLALRDRWLERRMEMTALEAQLELAGGR